MIRLTSVHRLSDWTTVRDTLAERTRSKRFWVIKQKNARAFYFPAF